jgi:hypothetical protein
MSIIIPDVGQGHTSDPSSYQQWGRDVFPLCPSLHESFVKAEEIRSLHLQQLQRQREHEYESAYHNINHSSSPPMNMMSRRTDTRLLFYPNNIPSCEVYVSSIKATFDVQTRKWRLTIMGEIGSRDRSLDLAFKSFHYLAICFVFLSSVYSTPWCFSITEFNYYADVNVNMDEPFHIIQAYAQHAVNGGKIIGSDVYFAIDARYDVFESLLNATYI